MRRPHIFVLIAFIINTLGPLPNAQADEFRLPVPGVIVHLSPPLDPPMLKGIKVHPDNPFRFDFILDTGDNVSLRGAQATKQSFIKEESTTLIKYFLASLTIPEKDLWVNLSPYEKNRIVPQSFGLTEMGRDLLAEDYMLKQITASLIYPEDETGRRFWKRVYEEAAKKFGTTNIPVNTFNKVWIVPEKAVVYENAKAGTAYIVESKLKVMLEQDYLALNKNSVSLRGAGGDEAISKRTANNDVNALGSNIIREIVIPELTKEVNEGKNFAQLRQVYNSLILASWYKKKIKDSILEQVYADKNKIQGLVIPAKAGIQNKNDVEFIYQRYLQAFKKGVFNYIKEETVGITGMPGKEHGILPRKYFSGGMDLEINVNHVMEITDKAMLVPQPVQANQLEIDVNVSQTESDGAMFVTNLRPQGSYELNLWESPVTLVIDHFKRVTFEYVEGQVFYQWGDSPKENLNTQGPSGADSHDMNFMLSGKNTVRIQNKAAKMSVIYKDLGETVLIAGVRIPKAEAKKMAVLKTDILAGSQLLEFNAVSRVLPFLLNEEARPSLRNSLIQDFHFSPVRADEVLGFILNGQLDTSASVTPVERRDVYEALFTKSLIWKTNTGAMMNFEDFILRGTGIAKDYFGQERLTRTDFELVFAQDQEHFIDEIQKRSPGQIVHADLEGTTIGKTIIINLQSKNFPHILTVTLHELMHIILPKSLSEVNTDAELITEGVGDSFSMFAFGQIAALYGNNEVFLTAMKWLERKIAVNPHEEYAQGYLFIETVRRLIGDNQLFAGPMMGLLSTAVSMRHITALQVVDRAKEIAAKNRETDMAGTANEDMKTSVEWNLKNAAILPDSELIRHAGITIREPNYVPNNYAVRGLFLKLLTGMKNGTIVAPVKMREELERLNRTMLSGVSGKEYYFSPTLASSEDITQIPGVFRDDKHSLIQSEKILRDLELFVNPDFSKQRTLLEVMSFIFDFYYHFMSPLLFIRGNNSLGMNMVNAMIRLYLENGISHGFLDEMILRNYDVEDIRSQFLHEVQEANPGIDFNVNAAEFLLSIQKRDSAMRSAAMPGSVELSEVIDGLKKHFSDRINPIGNGKGVWVRHGRKSPMQSTVDWIEALRHFIENALDEQRKGEIDVEVINDEKEVGLRISNKGGIDFDLLRKIALELAGENQLARVGNEIWVYPASDGVKPEEVMKLSNDDLLHIRRLSTKVGREGLLGLSGKRAGIGLKRARDRIEQSGGRVVIETDGVNTHVTVLFPNVDAITDTMVTGTESNGDAGKGVVTILDNVPVDLDNVWQQIRAILTSRYHEKFLATEQLILDSLGHKNPNLKYALALDVPNNKIIGYIFFDTSMRYSKIIHVSNLAVLPEYENQPVGIQLMQHVIEYADQMGHLPVGVSISSYQKQTMDFYDKLSDNIPGVRTYMSGFEGTAYYQFTYNPPETIGPDAAMIGKVQLPFPVRFNVGEIAKNLNPEYDIYEQGNKEGVKDRNGRVVVEFEKDPARGKGFFSSIYTPLTKDEFRMILPWYYELFEDLYNLINFLGLSNIGSRSKGVVMLPLNDPTLHPVANDNQGFIKIGYDYIALFNEDIYKGPIHTINIASCTGVAIKAVKDGVIYHGLIHIFLEPGQQESLLDQLSKIHGMITAQGFSPASYIVDYRDTTYNFKPMDELEGEVLNSDLFHGSNIRINFHRRFKNIGHNFVDMIVNNTGAAFVDTDSKEKIVKYNWEGQEVAFDAAMIHHPSNKTGGIDLTSDKALSIQNNGQGIKFHIDPAMLEQLKNTPGFVPVIIDIQPMTDLKMFLGISETSPSNPH